MHHSQLFFPFQVTWATNQEGSYLPYWVFCVKIKYITWLTVICVTWLTVLCVDAI